MLTTALDCTIFIVARQIAVFAEAFRVVGFRGVRAIPRFLGATLPVVAVDAHAFGIVRLVCVGAVNDFALLYVVRTVYAGHLLAVGTMRSHSDVALIWTNFLTNPILDLKIGVLDDVAVSHYWSTKNVANANLANHIVFLSSFCGLAHIRSRDGHRSRDSHDIL